MISFFASKSRFLALLRRSVLWCTVRDVLCCRGCDALCCAAEAIFQSDLQSSFGSLVGYISLCCCATDAVNKRLFKVKFSIKLPNN